MKVIINENDVKGILLKLWKENPYLDPIQMKMFGLSINNVSVLNMFSQFLGDEEIEKRLYDIIKLRKDFEITDCGNYRFKFQITDWSVNDGEIRIKCWVDVDTPAGCRNLSHGIFILFWNLNDCILLDDCASLF
jgi:hypothetical protein